MLELITLNQTYQGKKSLPDNFAKAVKLLKRPYIEITQEELEYIKTSTTDFILFRGILGTWGDADGVIKFMPVEIGNYS